jgi:hypothetical protein
VCQGRLHLAPQTLGRQENRSISWIFRNKRVNRVIETLNPACAIKRRRPTPWSGIVQASGKQ